MGLSGGGECASAIWAKRVGLEVYLHHYQLQATEHTCGALADVRSQVTVHLSTN